MITGVFILVLPAGVLTIFGALLIAVIAADQHDGDGLRCEQQRAGSRRQVRRHGQALRRVCAL